MDNINQPMILVKKADGTSVRMTLDEVKKMKQQASVPVKTDKLPVKEIKPRERVAEVSLYDNDDLKWTKDDNKSLLDDSFHKENLPAPISTETTMLSTISPVKNIFVDEAKSAITKSVQKNIDQPPSAPKSVLNIPPEAPIWAPRPGVSATINPLESKQLVYDVKIPKTSKQSIGPVEEIENFSLTDFRRLHGNVDVAGAKLLDKFKTLEHDSYILFIEGVEAWYNSPLYKEYQEIISKSLMQNKSIADVIAEMNPAQNFKMEEFKAILRLNQEIN